jgi:hypothetical protein
VPAETIGKVSTVSDADTVAMVPAANAADSTHHDRITSEQRSDVKPPRRRGGYSGSPVNGSRPRGDRDGCRKTGDKNNAGF